jgi:hypothetical protein
MPNPPDHLSTQAAAGDVKGQDGGVATPVEGTTEGATSLGADMARILVEDADVLAQQMVYHSQIMFGVSAMGTDAVNARNSVLVIANALRNGTNAPAVHALANLGDAQIAQVNDRTLPCKMGTQVAGLLEGLLLDSIGRAYKDDSDKQREARTMLERIFQAANEKAWAQPKGLVAFQAPGPGPNARS